MPAIRSRCRALLALSLVAAAATLAALAADVALVPPSADAEQGPATGSGAAEHWAGGPAGAPAPPPPATQGQRPPGPPGPPPQPERPRALTLSLTRDGRRWAGGEVRLTPIRGGGSTGAALSLRADGEGQARLALAPGSYRLAAGPGWPRGAGVRLALDEEIGYSDHVPPAPPAEIVLAVGGAAPGRLVEDGAEVHLDVISPRRVTGRVLADESGLPLAGARVAVVLDRSSPDAAPPLVEVEATPAGTFALEVPAAYVVRCSRYALLATAPDRALAALHLDLSLPDPSDEDDAGEARPRPSPQAGPPALDLTLRLAARSLTLAGQVTDLAGRPLAAEVRALVPLPGRGPGVTLRARSGADGRFELGGIPRGAGFVCPGPRAAGIDLDVEAEGHAPRRDALTLTEGAAPQALRLARLRAVSGRVRGADGAPLVDATLRVSGCGASSAWEGLELRTDAQGRFAAPAVPEACELFVRGPGHAPRRLRVRADAQPLDLLLAAEAPPIRGRVLHRTSRLASATTLRARVRGDRLELGGEDAPPPAELSLEGWTVAEATADAEGGFELRGLPPGLDLVLCAGSGPDQLARPGDEGLLLQPERQPERDPREPRAGRWRVRAVAAEDGTPLAATWTRHPPSTEAAWRPTAGGALDPADPAEAGDRALEPGEHSLWITAPGRELVERRVHMAAGGDLDLGVLRLRRAGTLEVRLRGWPTAGLVGLDLRLLQDGVERAERAAPPVRDDWVWQIEGLAAGPTTLALGLQLGAPGCSVLEHPRVRVVVRAGETLRLDLDLRDARPAPRD